MVQRATRNRVAAQPTELPEEYRACVPARQTVVAGAHEQPEPIEAAGGHEPHER